MTHPYFSRRTWLPRVGLASVLFSVAAWASDVPEIGRPWTVSDVPRYGAMNSTSDLPLRHVGPLSLAQLSDFALRNNPGTRAAWANAMADRAALPAARALLQPAVSFNVPLQFDRATVNGAASATAAASDITHSVAPSLGLVWVLFDFGARAAGVESARWQAVASELIYNRELQTVVSAVEQAYYGSLGARQLQAALQISVQAAQDSLDVVRARRQAGLATVGDTAQAEAAWSNEKLQLVRAQVAARSAQGSLANAMGLPVNTALSLADDETASLASGAQENALHIDQLLATARTSRADLVALSALVIQGDAQLAAAQAQGRPTLSLSAQVAQSWGAERSSGSTQQLALTLSVPLFDGGLVRAQTQAARARVQLLAAQRDQLLQSVELEVWQSFQNADSAQALIDSAQALLRSATVAEDAARERYKAGMGSLIELLLAQSTTAQARVSNVQARYDARLAVARLGNAVGARATSN